MRQVVPVPDCRTFGAMGRFEHARGFHLAFLSAGERHREIQDCSAFQDISDGPENAIDLPEGSEIVAINEGQVHRLLDKFFLSHFHYPHHETYPCVSLVKGGRQCNLNSKPQKYCACASCLSFEEHAKAYARKNVRCSSRIMVGISASEAENHAPTVEIASLAALGARDPDAPCSDRPTVAVPGFAFLGTAAVHHFQNMVIEPAPALRGESHSEQSGCQDCQENFFKHWNNSELMAGVSFH